MMADAAATWGAVSPRWGVQASPRLEKQGLRGFVYSATEPSRFRRRGVVRSEESAPEHGGRLQPVAGPAAPALALDPRRQGRRALDPAGNAVAGEASRDGDPSAYRRAPLREAPARLSAGVALRLPALASP